MATKRPPEKDFYSILGVEPSATAEQIHEAYRSRARISHPDRFNKETQAREWKIANEMLRDLNAAYAVLRDARTRRDYDQRRANGHATEPPKAERPKANATEPSFNSACSVRLSDLPAALQQRMIQRQQSVKQDQFQVSTDSLLWNYILLGIFACWFVYLYFAADSAKWKSGTNLWQSGATLFVAWLIAGQIIAVAKWCKSTLKSFFYITPLYYIKTDHDIITFWPIFALQDIAVAHNYRNGTYEDSKVVLKFEGHSETLTLSGKEQVEGVFNRLKSYDARLRKAHADDDDNYFKKFDDFADVPRTGIPADTAVSKPVTWMIRAASILVCGIAYFFFVALNENLSAKKWVEHATPPSVASSAAPVSPPKRAPSLPIAEQPLPVSDNDWEKVIEFDVVEFDTPSPVPTPPQQGDRIVWDDERVAVPVSQPKRVPNPPIPEQFVPVNGDVRAFTTAKRIAPFEIKTGGGQHYLVKLVDAFTKAPVLTVFVRGGQTATVDVPLGNYEVRYTCGNSWYGYKYLFGDSGSYSKTNETFRFSQTGNQVSGYTITLYPVEHGNLQTRHIEPTEF